MTQQAPLVRLVGTVQGGTATLGAGSTVGLDAGTVVGIADQVTGAKAQIMNGGIGAAATTHRLLIVGEAFRGSAAMGTGTVEQHVPFWWNTIGAATIPRGSGIQQLTLTNGNNGNMASLDSSQTMTPLDTMPLEIRSTWRAATGPADTCEMEFGLRNSHSIDPVGTQFICFRLTAAGLFCRIEHAGPTVIHNQQVSAPINASVFNEYIIQVSKNTVRWFVRTSTAYLLVGTYSMLGNTTTLFPGPNGMRCYVRVLNNGAASGGSSMHVSQILCSLLGNYSGLPGRRLTWSSLTDTCLVDGPGILESIEMQSLGTPQTWRLLDSVPGGAIVPGDAMILASSVGLAAGAQTFPRAYFGEGLYFDHTGGVAAASMHLTVRG
jgi:hypothetical protein